jgi:ABC-type transport system substrate-binding protein
MRIKNITIVLFVATITILLIGCSGAASNQQSSQAPSTSNVSAPSEPSTNTSTPAPTENATGGTPFEQFSILGKWKSTGEEGVGQAQPGAIIVFTENECNLYSPQDTYALYKDGDTLRLDATGLLGGTLKCRVVIVDNDHLELHSGSTVTYLQRVG